jgi:hypothetical protein
MPIADILINIWNLIFPYIQFIWTIIKSIWWIILPFFAVRFLHWSYLLWKNTKWLHKNAKYTMLEFKFPYQVTRPLRAMEDVFTVIWGAMFDPANPKEKYFEGKLLLSFSLEIVSLEGVPHFYARIPSGVRKMFEAAIQSQYPDVEIFEAYDYTKDVPKDIPNQEWDLWGCNYMALPKDDVYPIKTYSKFFEANAEIKDEEKRIDPLTSLIEGFTKIGKGEQIWFQIIASSASDDENDYAKRGQALINKLVKRPEKSKEKSLFSQLIDLLFFTNELSEGGKKDSQLMPPEMMLTPGERDVVSAIEQKISKLGFNCSIRSIYLAKRENYFGPNKAIPIAYMNQFQAKNLNGLLPWKPSITKIQAPDFFQKQRVYLRKRDLFLRYIDRDTIYTPFSGGTCLLNVEELTTLFHFPGIEVAPATQLGRLEVKKAAPPPTLPIEE